MAKPSAEQWPVRGKRMEEARALHCDCDCDCVRGQSASSSSDTIGRRAQQLFGARSRSQRALLAVFMGRFANVCFPRPLKNVTQVPRTHHTCPAAVHCSRPGDSALMHSCLLVRRCQTRRHHASAPNAILDSAANGISRRSLQLLLHEFRNISIFDLRILHLWNLGSRSINCWIVIFRIYGILDFWILDLWSFGS